VVVRYLNVIRIAIFEAKADPPLLVDVDGVLALSISQQGMEPIAVARVPIGERLDHWAM
jgi:hypothetical protein